MRLPHLSLSGCYRKHPPLRVKITCHWQMCQSLRVNLNRQWVPCAKDDDVNQIAMLRFSCSTPPMRRKVALEATIVEKYAAVAAFLDERGRRIWAASESRAIGYGGDALVSDATGLSRPAIRKGRRELESGGAQRGRIRRAGAGRPGIEQSQPGVKQAPEMLVDPVTRGDRSHRGDGRARVERSSPQR